MRLALLGMRASVYFLSIPLLLIAQLLQSLHKKELLLWGPVPIINNKYWSCAMAEAGWKSKTFMTTYYQAINRKEDFDLYFDDLLPWLGKGRLRRVLAPLLAHLFICRHALIVHIPFSGGPLGDTPIWRIEALLFRMAGVKTVMLPYGADVYRYSTIPDASIRNALLLSYPAVGREELRTEYRVRYWVKNADVIVMGYTLEGIGRWDVPAGNMVCIDLKLWKSKTTYRNNDGKNGPVRILHSPNHRGAKGTEFLLQSVEKLKKENYELELVLLERVQNEQVRQELQQADILADQFALPGYGLAAIEGMASGLAVMANLDAESYTRIFRRYSFLDECPILSATPETLTSNLRVLVTNPGLRRELGLAGRAYVEKYHSYAATLYLFGAIYAKLLRGDDIDLMNIFHPLRSSYNRGRPPVAHPLVENRLPPDYPPPC
jgi:glycosyltransferase involved in cell wall biosynthesis